MLQQPNPKPSALIFDMDGLMIDSERLYFAAEREMAAAHGKELRDEELWPLMGRKPIESLRLLRGILGIETSPEELLEWRNRLMLEKMGRDLGAMPGLFEILQTFHGRLKLAVGTGAQREFLDLALDTLGIRPYFAVLQTADAIERGKPDPEIYILACRRLKLSPWECIVLEDARNGVLAGKAAGCPVIAVPNDYTRDQDFGEADWIEPDLFAAVKRIESMLS
ncbi:MAG: HAD family phosphatase [Candidatus Aminicenantes bacterium]|nr:HAD family phosphatase [Candidatus Aminicenantes bacterium]